MPFEEIERVSYVGMLEIWQESKMRSVVKIKAFDDDEATDSPTLTITNGSIHRCIFVPRGSVLCGFTYLDCLNWRRLAAIEENALAVFDGTANENNAFTTTVAENLLIVLVS